MIVACATHCVATMTKNKTKFILEIMTEILGQIFCNTNKI